MIKNKIVGKIISINGPIVKAKGMGNAGMYDLVNVGKNGYIGEIIRLEKDIATIQVYEDNSMMSIGEDVISFRRPLSVLLGPGILEGIYDGLQRPLKEIAEKTGAFIKSGIKTDPLDKNKKWHFVPIAKQGDIVAGGNKIGYVDETELIRHFILIPPHISEVKIKEIVKEGDYTIDDVIAVLEDGTEVRMAHYHPVRKPRPYKLKLQVKEPLITGLRIIDLFFPLGKGGTAAIPGGFGTGKTMTQHSLAKWSDANVIVYIGCGERGNEMTDVLIEFPKLVDPKSNKPLMKRTVLIANTSNMPVAAREISIYTGITIAEYFRDMGYHVAVMADSTSRWAEALRELSGRLEEMPAEEGFPAYLPSRLAEFYERAGVVKTFNDEEGSISIIGAVSPPGGDFSEPVTQHTRRFIRCFWALDRNLANARHYPAISWLDSYSEYVNEIMQEWYKIDSDFMKYRNDALAILKTEERLNQIVKLIGVESLPDNQKLILLTADLIKKGVLQQNSFDPVDMYSIPEKQVYLIKIVMLFHSLANEAINKGVPLLKIKELKIVDMIVRLKSVISNNEVYKFEETITELKKSFDELLKIYI